MLVWRAWLRAWSLLVMSAAYHNSIKFQGSNCEFSNVTTRRVADHHWEYEEFWDCYASDTHSYLAQPGSEADLQKCAQACLDESACTGFNYPRGHLGPDRERRCFLKFRGDNQSTDDGVQCKNGRQTKFYDFYSAIIIDCGTKAATNKQKDAAAQEVVPSSSNTVAGATKAIESAGASAQAAPDRSSAQRLPPKQESKAIAKVVASAHANPEERAATAQAAADQSEAQGLAPRQESKAIAESVASTHASPEELAATAKDAAKTAGLSSKFQTVTAGSFWAKAAAEAQKKAIFQATSQEIARGSASVAGTVAVQRPIPNQQTTVNKPFSLDVPNDTFSSSVHSHLSLSVAQAGGDVLPGWLKFSAGGAAGSIGSFYGVPSARDEGTLNIMLAAALPASAQKSGSNTVSNSSSSASTTFQLTVLRDSNAVAKKLIEQVRGSNGSMDLVQAPPLPPPQYCHEDGVMYEPIDLDTSHAIQYVDNITACQQACRSQPGCGYYTYAPTVKMCHHSSPMAVKVETGPLFQGGPAACGHSGHQGAKNETVQNYMLASQCMTNNSYEPLMGRGRPGKDASDPIACQKQCEETDWCATFVYNVQIHLCFLQEKGAKPTASVALQISGPKTCFTQVVFYMRINIVSKRNVPVDFEKRKARVAGLLQAATVMTFSKYYPFQGNKPGQSQVLVSTNELKLHIENATNKRLIDYEDKDGVHTHLIVRVAMRIDPARAFYAVRLFKESNVTASIQKNCDELMPGSYSKIYNDLGLPPGTNIWLEKVYGAHIDRVEPDELFDESIHGQVNGMIVIESGWKCFLATAAFSAALAALACTWRQKPRCTREKKTPLDYLRLRDESAQDLCAGERCISRQEVVEVFDSVRSLSREPDSVRSLLREPGV